MMERRSSIRKSVSSQAARRIPWNVWKKKLSDKQVDQYGLNEIKLTIEMKNGVISCHRKKKLKICVTKRRRLQFMSDKGSQLFQHGCNCHKHGFWSKRKLVSTSLRPSKRTHYAVSNKGLCETRKGSWNVWYHNEIDDIIWNCELCIEQNQWFGRKYPLTKARCGYNEAFLCITGCKLQVQYPELWQDSAWVDWYGIQLGSKVGKGKIQEVCSFTLATYRKDNS